MAAKKPGTRPGKKGPTIIFQAGPQAGGLPGAVPEPEADPVKSSLEDMFAQLTSVDGGLVLIYRAPEENDRDLTAVYVGKVPLASFGGTMDGLLDVLRDKYGGGKFYVRLGDTKGRWHGKQVTVRVEKINIAPAAAAAAPPAAAVAAAPKLTDNPHFGKALELGITGIFGLLTAFATRGGGGNGVTVSDLVALQQANKQPDVFESMQKLVALKELFAPGEGASIPAAGGGAAGWMDLAKSVIQALPAVVGAQGMAPQQQPAIEHSPEADQEADSAPAPAAQQPAPPASGLPAASQAAQREVMISMLVAGASNDSPAAAYAIVIDDVLGRGLVEQLLSQPNPGAVIAGMFPALAPHGAWVAQLVESLRQLVALQEEEPAPAGQGKA